MFSPISFQLIHNFALRRAENPPFLPPDGEKGRPGRKVSFDFAEKIFYNEADEFDKG